jgi:transcriptional regulator NrdR family protein
MGAAVCCGVKSKTLDSRPSHFGMWRRRRTCVTCGRRWTTMEMVYDDALSSLGPRARDQMEKALSTAEESLRQLRAAIPPEDVT